MTTNLFDYNTNELSSNFTDPFTELKVNLDQADIRVNLEDLLQRQ